MLILKQIPAHQKWIQACHTVAEFMKTRPGAWGNHALVVLECDSLDCFSGQDYVAYREPDFENNVTGIATVEKKGLGNLRLLSV